MVEELLDASDKAQRVRKAGVKVKGSFVSPARVNVELTRIANRLKCLVAEAAGFCASGALDLCDRLLHPLLAAWPSMETGEQEELH